MSELQAPVDFMTSPDNLDTNLQSQRDQLKDLNLEKSGFDMKEKVQEIESPSKRIKQKASPFINEVEENEGMFNIFKETTSGERFLLFVGTVFAICIGAITPLFAETFGQVSSSLGPTSTRFTIYEDIRDVSVNLFSICLVQLLFSFIYTTCFVYVSVQMSIKMRNKFLQAILSQEQAWFDKQPDISGLATRLNIDCDQVQKGTGAKLAKIITDFSQMIVGFAYSFYKGWQLALVLSGLLPFCIGAGYWWIKRLQATNKLKKEAYTQAGGLAEEVLGNIKTVAAFNGQLKEYTKYENSLQQVLSKSLRNNFVFAIGGALFFFFFILVHCLTYFAGSHFIDLELEIRGEKYDAGVVLAVNLCMMIACFSLTMGLPCLKEFYDALSASKNLYSIINRKSQIDLYTGKIVQKLEGRIEFRDVCFKYENQENYVLNHFNLTIEAGQTFALCGPSGQGKSTVISLLQRFYDPNSGEILLDDQNIQLLNFSHVRNFISLVGQEPVLFSGTIEDNIRFGSLQATEEQIILAAQQAQIHSFILSNKEGYKTFINAGGSNLSGGQKQRIAIARAIVKDPKILLLDEATSALDREGEKEVQKAINSVKYGRTVFIIAHRLVTIQSADKIGVINQGRIWQLGTHQSLMAEEGIYRSLAAADEMATKERKKKEKKVQVQQDEIFLQETKSLTSINETNEQQKNAISRSFAVIKNKLWFLVIGCLGACGNGCGYPMQGMLMIQSMETLSEFGDDYEKKNNMTSLFWFLLAIYLLLIFFTQVSCFGSFSEHLTDKLRRLSMQSVLYQDVGYFDHEKNSSIKVCQRLQDDCVKVNGAAGQVFGTIFMSLFAVFGGLAVCFIFCY